MDNSQSKSINYYAAIGSGIAVSLLTSGVLIGLSFLASSIFKDTYGSTEAALWALIFLSLVLFFALPTLVIGRHGWRTVVTSYIIQASLLVIVVFTMTALFAPKPADNYYSLPDDCINC